MHGFDVHESGKTWHGRTSQKYPSILKRQQSRERREVSQVCGECIFITFLVLLRLSTYRCNYIRIKPYIT